MITRILCRIFGHKFVTGDPFGCTRIGCKKHWSRWSL